MAVFICLLNNKIGSVEKMFSEKHSPEPFRIYGAGFIVSEVFRHFSEGGQWSWNFYLCLNIVVGIVL